MPLLNVIIVLIVVGVLLYLVNQYLPMDRKIKSILNLVVVIAVAGMDAALISVSGVATGTDAGTYTSNMQVSLSGSALTNYNTPVITNADLVVSPKTITVTNTGTITGTTSAAKRPSAQAAAARWWLRAEKASASSRGIAYCFARFSAVSVPRPRRRASSSASFFASSWLSG